MIPLLPRGLNSGSDYGPEGLLFIPANKSPVKVPLIIVAHEVNHTRWIAENLRA